MNAALPAVGDEGMNPSVDRASARHPSPGHDDPRDALIRRIEEETRRVAHLIGKRALDPRVIRAMRRVPRQRFVPRGGRALAYESSPVPIGYGQTISQPFVVALMTDRLALEGDETVLEIGTGSGYQAAVLAELAARVYSVEILPELAIAAQHRLSSLGYYDVRARVGDGHKGWPEHAPYDAVMVTAAADAIPPALVAQLRPGGRLVIPLRAGLGEQWLVLAEKAADGGVQATRIVPVAFVPLIDCRDRPR